MLFWFRVTRHAFLHRPAHVVIEPEWIFKCQRKIYKSEHSRSQQALKGLECLSAACAMDQVLEQLTRSHQFPHSVVNPGSSTYYQASIGFRWWRGSLLLAEHW